MKKISSKFALISSKINLRTVLVLVTLALLVLGAGAPGVDGGTGGW